MWDILFLMSSFFSISGIKHLRGFKTSVVVSLMWQNDQLIKEEHESVDRTHCLIST